VRRTPARAAHTAHAPCRQPLSAAHHHCPIAAVPALQALQGPAGGAPGAESTARRLAAAAWPRVCTCVCERVPGPSPLAASYSLKQVGAVVLSAHLLGAAAAACYYAMRTCHCVVCVGGSPAVAHCPRAR